MKLRTMFIVALSVSALSVAGCSGSPAAAPQEPAQPKAVTPAAASTPAAKPPEAKPVERVAKRERPAADKAKVAQLFQIPQFTKPANPNNYNDARQDAVPQIRLIGFSKLDGQLKALVQIKGEILAVEQGDVVDGAEVVAVDADGVSFQFGGQRWASRLFERHNAAPVNVARIDTAAVVRPDSPISDQLKPVLGTSANQAHE